MAPSLAARAVVGLYPQAQGQAVGAGLGWGLMAPEDSPHPATNDDGVPLVPLPCGARVPCLGQGTWFMGEDPSRADEERRALRAGLDAGLTLVDTAEMYGDGAAEALVGEAIAGRRDEVFLVSKVLPWNATRRGTAQALEGSLRRLRTDYLDLYLYHWRGSTPLAESIEALMRLQEEGKIRAWGVSNLDPADLAELAHIPGATSATGFQTDQVLYNLARRGIEFDLLPRLRRSRVPVMAYSPIEQGRLLGHRALASVAARHGTSEAQVALAWVLRDDGVIAIPKSSTPQHTLENRSALGIRLTPDDLAVLDAAFPAPRRAVPLEML
ncbi:aldo/keto reductase [Sinomonas sp. JGH33]|uniref:Aldo/keto reductase n=1 Tax=Sinomonas terricola TaxID=3110330 RepID=A0ABU5T8Z0_9MICC|nr:aldo/keto reductase [Sinomonas sp. JGH33]MEA5456133.1 aldo/keto reductase [Sinomonas sp. JGH33]